MFVFFDQQWIVENRINNKLLLFQTANEFPYPDKICEICLNDLRAAFDFKHRCEIAFEQLMTISEVNNKCDEQIIKPSLPDTNQPLFVDDKLNSAIEIIENISIEPLLINVTKQKDEVFHSVWKQLNNSFRIF